MTLAAHRTANHDRFAGGMSATGLRQVPQNCETRLDSMSRQTSSSLSLCRTGGPTGRGPPVARPASYAYEP
jgi:hypothetical protein